MASRIWEIKTRNGTIKAKMLKSDYEAFRQEILTLEKIHLYKRELHGVIGEEERESTLFMPFGPSVQIKDPDGFEDEYKRFFWSIPRPVTEIQPHIGKARMIFNKYVFIEDHRETPEQRNERVGLAAAREEARLAKEFVWIDEHCRDRVQVSIPDGMMAVTIYHAYDNSDGMSDYYDPTRRWGQEMILGLVRKGAERESIARGIIARYPELASLSWHWHTARYDNYLKSEPNGKRAEGVERYGGGENPPLFFVVAFQHNRNLYAYKNYPGSVPQVETTSSTHHVGEIEIQVTHERDWTWLQFPGGKPPEETLDKLRNMSPRPRWGRRRKQWYFSQHVPEEVIKNTLSIGG